LVSWLVAMVWGTYEAYNVSSPTVAHFAGSITTIPLTHTTGYIGPSALVLNVVVAVVLTVVLRLVWARSEGSDQTVRTDYLTDVGPDLPTVVPVGVAQGVVPTEESGAPPMGAPA
jgi:SSS family solute:Na+ symporter